MIIITKYRNINGIRHVMRVYICSSTNNQNDQLKKLNSESTSTSIPTQQSPQPPEQTSNNDTSSYTIGADYVKSSLNKVFYFTSTTLNRLYLRENFLDKLNNSINASRNYINETITNTISKDDISQSIKKTIDKLDLNKNEIIGNKQVTNEKIKTNTQPVSAAIINKPSIIKLKPHELLIARRELENQTKFLCKSIKKSTSILIKTLYIEALSKHLYDNIETRKIIFEENIDKELIELKNKTNDKRLNDNINECLSMLGIINPIKKRGINILSLDGGGAKGFVTIEILKNLEKKTGKRIYELFDYVCGTSTGAILACLINIYKISLDECEFQYKRFVKEMFARNTAVAISNLLMSQSWYDTKLWEKMLREAMGDKFIIHSSRDDNTPKLSVVSSLTTQDHMKIYLFRNYNLPYNQQSHYEGTHKYCVWQAVRASSAAPGYYEDFKIEGHIFHDGGVIANNPSAIALHEAKQLWPNEELQCFISVGNGRFQPVEYLNKCDSLSIKQKVNRIVGGATSTETVTTVLHDLLPPKVYFRFNPYTSEEFHLDENRPDKWKIMQHDTKMYMRRNNYKFQMAANQLLKTKTPYQKADNFIKNKVKNLMKN